MGLKGVYRWGGGFLFFRCQVVCLEEVRGLNDFCKGEGSYVFFCLRNGKSEVMLGNCSIRGQEEGLQRFQLEFLFFLRQNRGVLSSYWLIVGILEDFVCFFLFIRNMSRRFSVVFFCLVCFYLGLGFLKFVGIGVCQDLMFIFKFLLIFYFV